jgi:NADPH-dependent ferric siderophore reductase
VRASEARTCSPFDPALAAVIEQTPHKGHQFRECLYFQIHETADQPAMVEQPDLEQQWADEQQDNNNRTD